MWLNPEVKRLLNLIVNRDLPHQRWSPIHCSMWWQNGNVNPLSLAQATWGWVSGIACISKSDPCVSTSL